MYRFKVVDCGLMSLSTIMPIKYEIGKWMKCPVVAGVKCPFFIFEYEEEALRYYNWRCFKNDGHRLFRLFRVKFKNSRLVRRRLDTIMDYHNQSIIGRFWNNDKKIRKAYGTPCNNLVCEEIFLWEEVNIGIN